MTQVLEEYLAPLLTIVGWGIILFNADRTALRSESRSAIDSCIEKLEVLIALTSDYLHEKNGASGSNVNYSYENKVASCVTFIEMKNNYLYKRTGKFFIEKSELIKLRRKLNPSASKEEIEDGLETVQDLIGALEDSFISRFSVKWYMYIPFWGRIYLFITLLLLTYFGLASFFIGA